MIDTDLDIYYTENPRIKVVRFEDESKTDELFVFEIKKNDRIIYCKETTLDDFKIDLSSITP